MRKFSSWKYLFVLVLVIFLFSGCGGSDDSGSSGSNKTSKTPNKTTKENTPTPNPETNADVGTYTDTYDIASVLNGEWYGLSGSGTITDDDSTYGLLLSSMTISVIKTQVTGQTGIFTGNTGTSYITFRQRWAISDGGISYKVLLYGDAERQDMSHVGVDMWRLEGSDGTVVTVTLTSETTAIVTEDGTVDIEGYPCKYSVRYTIKKR